MAKCWQHTVPPPLVSYQRATDCRRVNWIPRGEHDSSACDAVSGNAVACWPVDPWTRAPRLDCTVLPSPDLLRAFSSGFNDGYS